MAGVQRGVAGGCDDRGCRRDGGRRMRAIASVSACHRQAIVAAVADIRAWRARCGRAPDLSTSRAGPARDALSPPNKAHSHATERTRTHPSRTPYLNGTIVSHSFPPDILRRVIRYDTVRLFLQFSRSFFPLARYCSLVNFFS